MPVVHFYRLLPASHNATVQSSLISKLFAANFQDDASLIESVDMEYCFNVQVDSNSLSDEHADRLTWLLSETFDKSGFRKGESNFPDGDFVLEFGPRMTFTSAFSSNATQICQACGIGCIPRLERSRRYRITVAPDGSQFSSDALAIVRTHLHDRMTEEEYKEPKLTFESDREPEPVKTIPIMKEGRSALEKINGEMGLGFDDFDLDYYTDLFRVSGDPSVLCLHCFHRT